MLPLQAQTLTRARARVCVFRWAVGLKSSQTIRRTEQQSSDRWNHHNNTRGASARFAGARHHSSGANNKSPSTESTGKKRAASETEILPARGEQTDKLFVCQRSRPGLFKLGNYFHRCLEHPNGTEHETIANRTNGQTNVAIISQAITLEPGVYGGTRGLGLAAPSRPFAISISHHSRRCPAEGASRTVFLGSSHK